jgi:hypothetical protein
MAFNLTRAAGTLASSFHAKATTGTIRAQRIVVPGRLARSARHLTCTYPRHGPGRKQGNSSRPPRTARHFQLSYPPVRQDLTGERGDQPAHPAIKTRPHLISSKIDATDTITEVRRWIRAKLRARDEITPGCYGVSSGSGDGVSSGSRVG